MLPWPSFSAYTVLDPSYFLPFRSQRNDSKLAFNTDLFYTDVCFFLSSQNFAQIIFYICLKLFDNLVVMCNKITLFTNKYFSFFQTSHV